MRPPNARFFVLTPFDGHPRFYRRTRIDVEDGAVVETYREAHG